MARDPIRSAALYGARCFVLAAAFAAATTASCDTRNATWTPMVQPVTIFLRFPLGGEQQFVAAVTDFARDRGLEVRGGILDYHPSVGRSVNMMLTGPDDYTIDIGAGPDDPRTPTAYYGTVAIVCKFKSACRGWELYADDLIEFAKSHSITPIEIRREDVPGKDGSGTAPAAQ